MRAQHYPHVRNAYLFLLKGFILESFLSVCISAVFMMKRGQFVILHLLTLHNQNINSADDKVCNRCSHAFQCFAVYIYK